MRQHILTMNNLQIYIPITNLLQQILSVDGFQDDLLVRLLNFAAQHQLVQDEVGLLEVENYIQLAHLTGRDV